MKAKDDVYTRDMLGEKRRGRPPNPNAPTVAERQRARRARLADSGIKALTVELPVECIEALDKYLQFKGLTKNEVVERVIRGTIMRKR